MPDTPQVSSPDATDLSAPPRESWRHSVFALLLAIVFVATSAEMAYAVVNFSAMPVFIPTIGLTEVEANRWIGIVGVSFLLTEGVLKGPLGALGDRIGRKPLILAGPILSTLTSLLTPHIHNPYALVCLRVLDGIGAAALWPAVFSLIGDRVPEERRATAMSMFNIAYILGIAFGPSLGGNIDAWAQTTLHMSAAHSKIASFYAAAFLFGFTTLTALLFIPAAKKTTATATAHSSQASEAAGADPAEAAGAEGGLTLAGLKQMLARMPMTLLLTFLIFLGVGFVMLYVKRFAGEPGGPFHMSEQEFGNTLVVPALLIGVLSIPMGTLGDRIGKALAVRIGLGLCTLAYWLLLVFPNRLTLIAFGTLLGAGFVLAFPAWMALVTEQSASHQRGAVVGAVATAQGVGAIMGSALSAFLYPIGALALGPLPLPAHGLPFLMCGLLLACAFVLALFTVHAPRSGQTENTSLG